MLHAVEKSCDLTKINKPYANSEEIIEENPKLVYLGYKRGPKEKNKENKVEDKKVEKSSENETIEERLDLADSKKNE